MSQDALVGHDWRADRDLLLEAVQESRRCPPSDSAFSVGALLVDSHGHEVVRGHSRETGGSEHAEEVALDRLGGLDVSPADLTLYSSLEPCAQRRSRLMPCAHLIIAAGIRRVVFAAREPAHFVAEPSGAVVLEEAGVEVVELADLAGLVRAVNAHLPAWGHPLRR